MNTVVTLKISSSSSENSEMLGELLGKQLRGGEVIELTSDLGGGKTTFVRGLARGMGSKDHVSSPTFTISKLYHSGTLALHHFDFYRLPEAGIMKEELEEIMSEPGNVAVIEWAGIVKDILPKKRLKIDITVTGDDSRIFEFTYDKDQAYLVEGL